jgi:hypothetical protein
VCVFNGHFSPPFDYSSLSFLFFSFFFALLHNIKSFRPTSWMLWASGGALDQYARIWISLSLSAVQELAGELVYSTTNIYIRFSSAGNYHILLFFFSIFYIILYILSIPLKKKAFLWFNFFFSRFYIDVKRCQTCTSARTQTSIYFLSHPFFFHVPFSLPFPFIAAVGNVYTIRSKQKNQPPGILK